MTDDASARAANDASRLPRGCDLDVRDRATRRASTPETRRVLLEETRRPDPSDASLGSAHSPRGEEDASRPPGQNPSRLEQRRVACAWCRGEIPHRHRRDSIFCSKRCRQASWRFGVDPCGLEGDATDRPRTFAYADPPYPGKAGFYPERREVDHADLIARLVRDYPDGWALSTSAEALRDVWALCPARTRLAVWVRSARHVRSARAVSAFEAVIVYGGRPHDLSVAQDLEDALVYRGRFRSFPGALVCMKPPQFSVWMFRLLGARRGDRMDDIYPGSGAVSLAWKRYIS